MDAQFRIGEQGDGRDFSLDLERLIGSHACIIANSGGGKSGLIRRILEVTHGRIQQIVLDIEDEFYTMREAGDYVIAGGAEGDCPATVGNAAQLAKTTLEAGFSLVVQLNDLGMDGARDFVGAFLSALMTASRELWRPLLVVIDEAHRFAPSEGRTTASDGVRSLTGQGRKRGFTALLASQRIAKIDADVRGDVNNWMLGRVGQALDRRTASDVLGFSPSSAEARGLQGMPPRTFWGFGPALEPMPTCFTVDDVVTTCVRPGQAKVPTPPAPEALREVLAALTDPASGVKLKSDFPETVISGESLKSHPEFIAMRDDRDEMERRALAAEQLLGGFIAASENVTKAIGYLHDQHALSETIAFSASQHIEANGWEKEDLIGAFDGEPASTYPPVTPELTGEEHGTAERPICPQDSEANEDRGAARNRYKGRQVAKAPGDTIQPAGGLTATQMSWVKLLDRINPAKVTWTQAASILGRKARGGNFNATRKALRASSLIIEEGDYIRSANPVPQGLTRRQAIDLWKSVLPPLSARMIDALDASEAADEYLTKEGIGHAIGATPRGGHFNTGLAALRNNGLLHEYGSGSLRLANPLPGESV